MINHCFIQADVDELKALGCDIIEKDIIGALWKGLPFHEILTLNWRKYQIHARFDV